MHAPLNCAQCLWLLLCALALAGCNSLDDPGKLWEQLLESSIAPLTRTSAQSVCKTCPITTTTANAVAMVNAPIDVFNEDDLSFSRPITDVELQLHDKPVSKTQLTIFTLALIPHRIPAYASMIAALMLSEETSMRQLTYQEPERLFFQLEFLEQTKKSFDPIFISRLEQNCIVILAKHISDSLSDALCNSISAVIDKKIDYYWAALHHVSLHSVLALAQDKESALNVFSEKLDMLGLARTVIDAYNGLPIAIEANQKLQKSLVHESLTDFQTKLRYTLKSDVLNSANNSPGARNVFVAILIEQLMHKAIQAKLEFGKAKEQVIIAALASMRHEPQDLLWNAPNVDSTNGRAEQLIWNAEMTKGINWLALKRQQIAQQLRILLHHHNVFAVRKAQLHHILSNFKSETNAVWLEYDTSVFAPPVSNTAATALETAIPNQDTSMPQPSAPAVTKPNTITPTTGRNVHASKNEVPLFKSAMKVLSNTKIVIEEPDLGTPQPFRSSMKAVDPVDKSRCFEQSNKHISNAIIGTNKSSAAKSTSAVAKATPALPNNSETCQSKSISRKPTDVTTSNVGSIKSRRKNRFKQHEKISADVGDSIAGIKPGELAAYIEPSESTKPPTEGTYPIEDLLSITSTAAPNNDISTPAKIFEPRIENPVENLDESSVLEVNNHCHEITDALQTLLPEPLQVYDVDSCKSSNTSRPTMTVNDTTSNDLSQAPNDAVPTSSSNTLAANATISLADASITSNMDIPPNLHTAALAQERNPLSSNCPTVAMSNVSEAPVQTNITTDSSSTTFATGQKSKSKNAQRKLKKSQKHTINGASTITAVSQSTDKSLLTSSTQCIDFVSASSTVHNSPSVNRDLDQTYQAHNGSKGLTEIPSQTPKTITTVPSLVEIAEESLEKTTPVVAYANSTLSLILKRLNRNSKSYVEEKKKIVKLIDAALGKLAAQRNELLSSMHTGFKEYQYQAAYLKSLASSIQASIKIKVSLAKELCVAVQEDNSMEFKIKFSRYQALLNLSFEEVFTKSQTSVDNTISRCIDMFYCCSLLNYNIELLQEFRKLVIADNHDPVSCLAKNFTVEVKREWNRLESDICSDNSIGFSAPVPVPIPSTVESFINLLDQQIPNELSQVELQTRGNLSQPQKFISKLESSENGVYADILGYGASLIRYENEVFETKRNRAKFLLMTKVVDPAYIREILIESLQ